MKSAPFLARTKSAGDTRAFGARLGTLLASGDVVALDGPLGAGKTTLVKGMARGLGIKDDAVVASPTFVLMHEYQGREKMFHIDWYRLDKVGERERQMALECFDADAVTFIEWASRAPDILPKKLIRISLKHGGGNSRDIRINGSGERYENLARALKKLS